MILKSCQNIRKVFPTRQTEYIILGNDSFSMIVPNKLVSELECYGNL